MASFFNKGDALFGFLKSGRNKNNEIVFRPVWGRVFATLFSLALVGWLTAALAVMLFVRHKRGFEGGRYQDIVFFWRWDDYEKAWGEEFIERGHALLEEGKTGEAIHLIRVGHVKSPTNLKARLTLSEYYKIRGRSDLAAKVLREGVPHADGDLEYIRTTFQVLLANQDDDGVREIAGSILGRQKELNPYIQTTALAAANAHFHRGAYDAAEDLLVDYELSANPEGRVLLAQIDWERGQQREALARLEALVAQNTEQEEVYSLLTRYHRELGNATKAHGYAVMRQVNNPFTPEPRIALLYSYHASGEEARVTREAGAILKEFGRDSSVLVRLAEFAASIGNIDLAGQVLEALDKQGLPLDVGLILLAEAHLEAGQYREAIDLLERHSRENEHFAERYGALINGYFAVANFGLGDVERGEIHLTKALGSRGLRAETFVILSQKIMEFDLRDQARRIMAHAHETDPLNQTALTQLIRLDLEVGRGEDLLPNIKKLLTMRKPSRSLLEESVAKLGRDRFLFLPDREAILHSIHAIMGGEADDPLTHS